MSMANNLCPIAFLLLPLGGGSVRNLRAEQITLNDILVEWNHASFIPSRGYRIRVLSQEIEEGVNITSITITIGTGVGRYEIVVWPVSSHFASIPLAIWVTLKGEKWVHLGVLNVMY